MYMYRDFVFLLPQKKQLKEVRPRSDRKEEAKVKSRPRRKKPPQQVDVVTHWLYMTCNVTAIHCITHCSASNAGWWCGWNKPKMHLFLVRIRLYKYIYSCMHTHVLPYTCSSIQFQVINLNELFVLFLVWDRSRWVVTSTHYPLATSRYWLLPAVDVMLVSCRDQNYARVEREKEVYYSCTRNRVIR